MSIPRNWIANDYSKGARCPRCLLGPGLCVCAELPTLSLPYRFVIVRHRNEIGRQSNTGSLAARMIAGTLLLDHGVEEGPFDPSPLSEQDVDYRLLYPAVDAEVLRPNLAGTPKPLTFVVLDASWPKARRMTRRIPQLHGMPKVALPGPPQGPSLRKPHGPQRYYTLEAIARVIETLGPRGDAEALRSIMEKVISRRLHERGKIPRSEVI